ncbi:B12-binding domain-containing protein [Methanolobus mangrovi]|uniref:B12-binding domain-containing protein n=1 Tax=Methanolobus mangrovi TaxID=3072977 RepID=A0AA51UGT2_9EURY|nr:B12-binding domain-containing protein [Methanolobus mangrovi]WMW21877.1 B12-binding domain-containing protein [Methanolobus mangrovi]
MSQQKIITQLIENAKNSILDFDEEGAENVAMDALEMGLDINDFIEKGFLEGMKAVGDMFEEGNACLLHIFAASNAMKAGLAVLENCECYKKANDSMVIELVNEGQRDEKIEILEAMFRINGYDVVEISDNVPIVDFIEKDRGFLDIPSSCKEEFMATLAANPRVTTFQLCDLTKNLIC